MKRWLIVAAALVTAVSVGLFASSAAPPESGGKGTLVPPGAQPPTPAAALKTAATATPQVALQAAPRARVRPPAARPAAPTGTMEVPRMRQPMTVPGGPTVLPMAPQPGAATLGGHPEAQAGYVWANDLPLYAHFYIDPKNNVRYITNLPILTRFPTVTDMEWQNAHAVEMVDKYVNGAREDTIWFQRLIAPWGTLPRDDKYRDANRPGIYSSMDGRRYRWRDLDHWTVWEHRGSHTAPTDRIRYRWETERPIRGASAGHVWGMVNTPYGMPHWRQIPDPLPTYYGQGGGRHIPSAPPERAE